MSETPVAPDLDFVRYADDIQHSTSLKKYIESGKNQQQKQRHRRRASKEPSCLTPYYLHLYIVIGAPRKYFGFFA